MKEISDQSLKLSTLPIPITHAKSPKVRAAENRETIFSSSKYATLGSSREIALLKAAIDSNAKKAGPTILPNGISTNADNKLMAFHDPTVDRVTNHKGKICDFTSSELKKIRVNQLKRFNKGDTPRIIRFGHYGINSLDIEKSLEWYHEHLGIIASDILQPPSPPGEEP